MNHCYFSNNYLILSDTTESYGGAIEWNTYGDYVEYLELNNCVFYSKKNSRAFFIVNHG